MSDVMRQRSWTDDELSHSGYARYERKKQLVMARRLLESEAPMTFVWLLETIAVGTDYVVCYDPGQEPPSALSDYDHWPVRNDLFQKSYRRWDETGWLPTRPQRHLLQSGCEPFFKAEHIWAKKLSKAVLVQTLESRQPVLVPAGLWPAIGVLGEPWYIDEKTTRLAKSARPRCAVCVRCASVYLQHLLEYRLHRACAAQRGPGASCPSPSTGSDLMGTATASHCRFAATTARVGGSELAAVPA